MTAKELKRLRRSDLLEMLLTLRRENDALREQLAQAQAQLENRNIEISKSGSLAEAALRLNGVFEAAQTACEQYVDIVRQRMHAEEQETLERCRQMLAQAGISADTTEGDLHSQCPE